jgi:hypothetical protein
MFTFLSRGKGVSVFTKYFKIEAENLSGSNFLLLQDKKEVIGGIEQSYKVNVAVHFAGLAGGNILRKMVNPGQPGDTKPTGPFRTAGLPEKKTYWRIPK